MSRNSDSDDESHNSDDEQQEESPPARSWEELKTLGNDFYKEGQYDEAAKFYTAAIDVLASEAPSNSSAVLFSNRSVCHMKQCKFHDAEKDARKSIEHDPQFIKPITRLGQALCGLGRFEDAGVEFMRGLQVAKARKDNVAIADLGVCLKDAQAAAQAVSAAKAHLLQQQQNASTSSPTTADAAAFSSSPPASPTSSLIDMVKAVGAAYIKYDDCFPLALLFAELQAPVDPEKSAAILARISAPQSLLRNQCETSAEYVYMRALVAYHGNASTGTANAQQLLRSAMELDPDNVKIQRLFKKVRNIELKKQAGNDAYKARKWADAVAMYTEAIQLDSNNKRMCGVLYANRGAAKIEINDHLGALRDVDMAIDRGNDAAKIYARRSKIYEKLGKYDNAKQDLTKAAEMDEQAYGGREMREFDERMRIAKRKNYYDILGVPKTIAAADLKAAYRKEAFKWHPDKWAHAGEDEKKHAETKFKEVGEAFSLLSDPQKRRLYDDGRLDNETEGVRGGGGGGGGGGGVDLADMMSMFGGGFPGGGRRGGPPPGFQFSFG